MGTLVSALISRIRRRADFVSSTFLSDANDIVPWINQSHKELWELVQTVNGAAYFMLVGNVTASLSAEVTPLTGINFEKLLRVDVELDGTRVPLRRANSLTDMFIDTSPQAWSDSADIRYHLEGSTASVAPTDIVPTLRIYPVPNANHVLRVYYVPTPKVIASSSIETIYTILTQWDEYIVVDCAAKAKIKADEDPSPLLVAKVEIKSRIENSAANWDRGQPGTVADIQSTFGEGAATSRDWWW